MAKLIIIRHCETDSNKQKRYLGETDEPLNSVGRKQAKELADKVNELHFDILVSSPLKRALETAEIINQGRKEIIIEPRFKERNMGVYEGLTESEAKEKFPDIYSQNIARVFDKAAPGGETVEQVQKRVLEALKEVREKYNEKDILIVTHGFVAKAINKYFNPQISDQEFFDFALKNGELVEYVIWHFVFAEYN